MVEASETAHVALYVGDFRLEGDLHVGTAHGGEKRRVSDVINSEADFLALTNVSMTEPHFMAEEPEQHDIIIIRKGEIKFCVPLD